MHCFPRVTVLVSLLALGAHVVAQDPIGAYRGVIKANKAVPMIPPNGIPLRAVLKRVPPDGLAGKLQLAGTTAKLSSLERDDDRAWKAETVIMGLQSKVRFWLEDHDLVGRIEAGGFTVDFRAERTVDEARPVITRNGPAVLDELETAQWLEDLVFLENQLPALHAKWFEGITPEQWSAAVEELRGEISELSVEQIVMRFAQLITMRGDAHTSLGYGALPEFAGSPVEFLQFPEGVFVARIAASHATALGARVLSVGGTPIADVLQRLATVRASENEQWKRGNVAVLRLPAALFGLGLLSSREELPLVVRRDGEKQEIALPVGGADMVGPFDSGSPAKPVWLTKGHKPYWFASLDRGATMYIAYNRCLSDPRYTFVDFAADLVEQVERRRPQRVFVDLRRNGGGASLVLSPIIDWLGAHPVLNHPSRSFIAIGPKTFSSAMVNAAQFDERTGATLIGEPTGGKPNAYGEVRGVRLPQSGIFLWFSTNHFNSVPGDPPSVNPHRRVDLSAEDYFAGHDPVLVAVRVTEPEGAGWDDVANATGVAGVWGGAFEPSETVSANVGGAISGGGMSFVLAVSTNSDGTIDAAMETVMLEQLMDTKYDADRRVLSGRVALLGFAEPVPVSFEFGEQTVRAKLSGKTGGVPGHGLRQRGQDAEVLIVRAQFETRARVPEDRAAAQATGERLLALLREDAPALNSLAWRLLTEQVYGQRFDELALEASRHSNDLTNHSDWQHLDTRALAEFRASNIAEAVRCEKLALELVGSDPRREEVEAALRRFEAALGK